MGQAFEVDSGTEPHAAAMAPAFPRFQHVRLLAPTVPLAGQAETRLAQDTFLWLELAPGAIDGRCAGTDGSADAVVNVGPGETRFVEVAYRPGLMGSRCAVTEVAEARGRAAMHQGIRAVGP